MGKPEQITDRVCEEGRLELVVNLIKTKRELLKVDLRTPVAPKTLPTIL